MSLGFLSFLLTTAFADGMASASLWPRWGLLMAAVPMILFWLKPGRFTVLHLLGLGWLAYAAASLAWTANPYDGVHDMAKLLMLAGVFGLAARAKTLKLAFIGMSLGLIPSSAIALWQVFVDQAVVINAGNAITGLFYNQNTFAETSALVLIGIVAYAVYDRRLWWFALPCLPGIVMTGSRAAPLMVLAAVVVWLWNREYRLTVLAAVPVALSILIVPIINGHKIAQTEERIALYLDTIDGMTAWGNGLGSFQTAYPYGATRLDISKRRPENAHNDYLELVFELGPGAGFGLSLLAGCLFGPYPRKRPAGSSALCGRTATEPARLVLTGFAVGALVAFPFHLPCSAFLAAVCAGHCSRARPELRDELWVRRLALYTGVRLRGSDREPDPALPSG